MVLDIWQSRPAGTALCLGTLTALTGTPVSALELAGGTTRVQPTISMTQTLTDNYQLVAQDKSSDAITSITAGLRGQLRSARSSGFLDYALIGQTYARRRTLDTLRHTLSSGLQAELVESRVTLDASANIGRTAVSAFGVSPNTGLAAGQADQSFVGANSAEVRSLRVSPTFRGPLGIGLRYLASVDLTRTDVGSESAGTTPTTTGSTAMSATVQLAPVTVSRLGWGISATHQGSNFSGERSTASDRVQASGTYNLADWDLQLGLSAGREYSDVTTRVEQASWTAGGSLVWAPSPITSLAANVDRQAFGNAYRLALTHRTPRTSWQAGGSRQLNLASTSTGLTGQRSVAYELLFAQLASVQPDPIKRAELVLAQLQQAGLDANARASGGFLTGAATVVTQWQLSVAWSGQRDSVMLNTQRSQTRRADSSLSTVQDDLLATGQVQSQDVNLNVSHSLTPTARLSLTASWQRTSGEVASQRRDQRLMSLLWSETLGPYVTITLGVRRSLYDLSPASFSESALTAALGARF